MDVFDALFGIARNLQALHNGLATGGSTTTLVDTTVNEPDDWFNGGVLFLHATKKTAIPTDWVSSTHTLTIPTQSASVSIGARYSLCTSRFPRDLLVQAMHDALQEIGYPDSTFEIVSVANQLSYTLDGDAYINKIKRVEVQVSGSSPTEYVRHYHWVQVGQTLNFISKVPTESGLIIKLWADTTPQYLTDDADTLPDEIHILRLAWNGAYNALMLRLGQSNNSESLTNELLKIADAKRAEFNNKYPVGTINRDPILPGYRYG